MTSIAKQIGTNWFTVVMGVGIMGGLTYTSPMAFPDHDQIGILAFLLGSLLLVVALILWTTRWIMHTQDALHDFLDPTRALFYGALAMAVNVIGNDFFLVGTHIFPREMAIHISQGLWLAGVFVSLFSVIAIPYLMFTQHEIAPEDAVGSWLIPVVPPIVAAADGANILPYWGNKGLDMGMTAFDLTLFGMTFFLFLMISALFYMRLMYHRVVPGHLAPSVWIEIGPIGMAMGTLATIPLTAHAFLPSFIPGLRSIGLIGATALWGTGVWWSIIATLYSLMHLSKRGEGIPYSLGWWSYVFPLGSFTAGTYALYHLTDLKLFFIAAFVQLLVLAGCFVIVSLGTLKGIMDGTLLAWRPHHHHRGVREAKTS
ncbi:C4-dicarboxylate ABC transporter [Sulfoacidibacillus thermotolerans]|uniref:C4-dicarboxylate ABC transporter n=1 Tax=Sulfoacidibacillus thermotolerans TaxID=1765684 RepID=A0A2U3D6S7_SULT2|nr:C4-dicarboxylate ABC transporter [Sulfoacidibacillus thermotolerans]PWI56985.1 C4-dicarboxylate ABC transporter [Sulfoacidibacillus thermotolerans]